MPAEKQTVLEFPVQMPPKNRELTDEELVTKARIVYARLLNQVYRGEVVLTEELKLGLLRTNETLRSGGYRPIDVDFTRIALVKNE